MSIGSPEWLRVVTASKVAAILGLSPWDSPRSMWHRMHGDLPPEPEQEHQSRGHYLEPAILAWWQDRYPDALSGWVVQPSFGLDGWAAATPDAACALDDEPALVEAKSAATADDWGDPGTDEIPLYYAVQAMFQMHISGIHRTYMPVLFGKPRLGFAEYVIDYDPAMGATLEARCRAFYDSLAADEPPELDNTTATYDAIRKVHPEIDAKVEVEIGTDLATEFVTALREADTWEATARHARSRVIEAMGRAQYAVHQGERIARRQRNKSGVSFVPLHANTFTFLTGEVA